MFSGKEDKTIVFSACTIEPHGIGTGGGCHAFGKKFAGETKVSSAVIVRNSEFDMKVIGDAASKPYENICITGCECLRSHLLTEISKSYNLKNLKNIYIITPPHFVSDEHDKILGELKSNIEKELSDLKITTETGCSLSLLTTDLDTKPYYALGMPKSLSHSVYKPDDNLYGLMYFRDLNAINPDVISQMLIEGGSVKRPIDSKKYLELYFSSIAKKAKKDGVSKPYVIVTYECGSADRTIILEMAKKFEIEVVFKHGIPPQEFARLLSEIGKNNGIVATNGTYTLIQAFSTKCQVLFHANKAANDNLLNQLVKLIPDNLRNTATVMLGLSDEVSLLEDSETVSKVYEIIHSIFIDAHLKFESSKTKPLPSELLLTTKLTMDSDDEKSTEEKFIIPSGDEQDYLLLKKQLEEKIIKSMNAIKNIYKLGKREDSTLNVLLGLETDQYRTKTPSKYGRDQIDIAVYEWAKQQKDTNIQQYLKIIDDNNLKREKIISELRGLYEKEIKEIDSEIQAIEKDEKTPLKKSKLPQTVGLAGEKKLIIDEIKENIRLIYKNISSAQAVPENIDDLLSQAKSFADRGVGALIDLLKRLEKLDTQKPVEIKAELERRKSNLIIDLSSLGFRVQDEVKISLETYPKRDRKIEHHDDEGLLDQMKKELEQLEERSRNLVISPSVDARLEMIAYKQRKALNDQIARLKIKIQLQTNLIELNNELIGLRLTLSTMRPNTRARFYMREKPDNAYIQLINKRDQLAQKIENLRKRIHQELPSKISVRSPIFSSPPSFVSPSSTSSSSIFSPLSPTAEIPSPTPTADTASPTSSVSETEAFSPSPPSQADDQSLSSPTTFQPPGKNSRFPST